MADKDIKNTPNPTDPAENSILVKRSGKQVAKLQQRIKVTKWVLLSLLLFVIILYLLFIFFWRGGLSGDGNEPDYGDFTVQIDEGTRNLISLSEDVEFKGATIRLQGSSLDDMWHCTRDWIPSTIQDNAIGGSHHSSEPSYFAYTFYLKNVSDEEINYTYDFVLVDKLINKEYDALDAVRVMFIRNGEKTVWAKDSIDGTPIEENTLIFSEEPKLVETADNLIAPGAIDKYTVVMWLEGEDPECINDIFANVLKFEMNFEVQNKFSETADINSETSEVE